MWQTRQSLDGNCDESTGPTIMIQIPVDRICSEDSKYVRHCCVAPGVLKLQVFLWGSPDLSKHSKDGATWKIPGEYFIRKI